MDDGRSGPGDGPGEGGGGGADLAQTHGIEPGLAHLGHVGPPARPAQDQVTVADTGRSGQGHLGVLSLEGGAQATRVPGDASSVRGVHEQDAQRGLGRHRCGRCRLTDSVVVVGEQMSSHG